MNPTKAAARAALVLLLLSLAACGAADLSADAPAEAADAIEDGEAADLHDATPPLPHCGAPAGIPDPLALGLEVRAPVMRHLVCTLNPQGFEPMEADAPDVNWVCTFDHAGTFGVLSLAARAVDCHWDLGTAVDYQTSSATLAACGQLLPLADARYDWGGNHHNDFLQFRLGGLRYQVFHSSFNFKWRSCQPPDCLKVYDAATDQLQKDGCTRERTLPVVCVPVSDDGSVPPLVDTFERCEGDG